MYTSEQGRGLAETNLRWVYHVDTGMHMLITGEIVQNMQPMGKKIASSSADNDL